MMQRAGARVLLVIAVAAALASSLTSLCLLRQGIEVIAGTESNDLARMNLRRIFYINLERRAQRRARFEKRAQELGLMDRLSRFPAVDGRLIDFESYPRSVVTEAGVSAASAPPAVVNGAHLTPGALGLILSYHTLLQRIAADQEEESVYVVAEDDAVLEDNFVSSLGLCLHALHDEDSRWDFLHLGYYDDDCSLAPLRGPANRLLCQPIQVYGLFGAALRPRGAAQLLKYLFPLDEQIDSSLARVYDKLNAYAVRTPLMRAPHSTPGNTDIQILPEG
ncbi:Cercam [Symbiodinium sp. CCMP2456]|nr:Cercam [Symbiodinium sp. CCMP2456]